MDKDNLPFQVTIAGSKEMVEQVKRDLRSMPPLTNEELKAILNGKAMTQNGKTIITEEFDFSDEYLSETIDLGIFNGYPFFVTVQEIPHGIYTQLQKKLLGKMRIPENKDEAARMMREKEVDPVQYSDNRNLAGIKEWTLKRKDGTDIPVCDNAWNALPHRITEQIETAIARVNPEMDSDFHSDTGNENPSE